MTGTTSDLASAQLAEQHPSTLAFEILAGVPDVAADPVPRYHALRAMAPVHTMELPMMGVLHVLSRYADCKAVLASHEFGKGDRDRGDALLDEDEAALYDELQARSRPMLFLNPPDHTRIRGLVSRAFTPRRIEALRPTIDAMVADVLDPLADGGEVDLLDVLAFPLPVAVIGALVGVPAEDHGWFRQRVRDGAATLEFSADAEVLRRGATALGEMNRLLPRPRRGAAGRTAGRPAVGPDRGRGRRRPPHPRRADLERDPAVRSRVRDDDEPDRQRHRRPHRERRPARPPPGGPEPAALGGRGDPPLRLAGAARRPHRAGRHDASRRHTGRRRARPPSPCSVRPTTTPPASRTRTASTSAASDNAPLSFAWGIHHCIGAGLARAEGAATFDALLDRFSAIEVLDDPPQWRPGLTLRGLQRLPVRLTR